MLRGAGCGVCGAEECLREEEQVRDAGGRVWRRKRGLSGDTDTSSAACGQHLPLKGKAGGRRTGMLRGAGCGVCGAEECLLEGEQVRDAGGQVLREDRRACAVTAADRRGVRPALASRRTHRITVLLRRILSKKKSPINRTLFAARYTPRPRSIH